MFFFLKYIAKFLVNLVYDDPKHHSLKDGLFKPKPFSIFMLLFSLVFITIILIIEVNTLNRETEELKETILDMQMLLPNECAKESK